jgi:hypothetical protein
VSEATGRAGHLEVALDDGVHGFGRYTAGAAAVQSTLRAPAPPRRERLTQPQVLGLQLDREQVTPAGDQDRDLALRAWPVQYGDGVLVALASPRIRLNLSMLVRSATTLSRGSHAIPSRPGSSINIPTKFPSPGQVSASLGA